MISNAASACIFVLVVALAVAIAVIAPWIADLIFNLGKAFLAARAAGEYTFGVGS